VAIKDTERLVSLWRFTLILKTYSSSQLSTKHAAVVMPAMLQDSWLYVWKAPFLPYGIYPSMKLLSPDTGWPPY
jgi:hypothetical protein